MLAMHRLWISLLSPLLLVASGSPLLGQIVRARLDGDTPGGRLGAAIAALGDIDGDGVSDFIVGEQQASPNGFESGRARVYSGVDLSVLYTLAGDAAGDWLGAGVGAAGDVDGDSVPDFVVGAIQYGVGGPGYVRVHSGADGSLIRQHTGNAQGDALGWAVTGIGDIDLDGRADVLATAYYEDTPNGVDSGGAHVYSGATGAELLLAAPIRGDGPTHYLGRNAAALGDVDGDGIPDFAISQPFSSQAGQSSGSVRVYSGADGSTIRTVVGESAGDTLGQVSSIGDADGDGVSDFAVGGAHPSATRNGRVYVISGATGQELARFDGAAPDDWMHHVGRVGDVDGDGYADVACGADAYVRNGQGYVRIHSVQTGALIAQLSPGEPSDAFGYRVTTVGDLDGDGLEELAIGAPGRDALRGSVYLMTIRDGTPKDLVLCMADGDGVLDAATANALSNDVSLRLGDGLGDLGAVIDIALDPADREPCAIAAGALGGAAGDDLAVACAGSSTVALVVDPAGAPVVTSLSSGGARPAAIAVGDLDGTGTDDIVVGREGAVLGGAGSGLAVSLGGAAFTDLTIPGGHPTRCVDAALCDLDGDGDVDLAAIAQGAPNDEVLLFAGDGTGSLTWAGALALGSSGLAGGLSCDDLDGDGDRDLLAGWSTLFPAQGSNLRVFTFTGSAPLDASDYTVNGDIATGGLLISDVACGDLDGTSFPGWAFDRDVVIVHGGSADAVILGGLDAATAAHASTASLSTGVNPVAGAIGDLNGDGLDDVFVAAQSGGLSVTLGAAVAVASAFGSGCAGTGGLVPSLAALGLPTLGNPAFGLRLTDARASAPVVLMFSTQDAAAALPPSTCTLHLGGALSSLVRFTDASGAAPYVFGVPDDGGLAGLDLFFQSAVFDPGGALAGVVAFSDAVRAQVGR